MQDKKTLWLEEYHGKDRKVTVRKENEFEEFERRNNELPGYAGNWTGHQSLMSTENAEKLWQILDRQAVGNEKMKQIDVSQFFTVLNDLLFQEKRCASA